jgi:hypothetical protein
MPKKAFVSYAHESAEHKNQVLAFATLLRQNGVEAVLDLWAADARIDWYAWALKEMTEADYVVVVASGKYRHVGDGSGPSNEHRGVQSEAALLRDLLWGDRATWLAKILPVLLPGHDLREIPLFLQPSTASRYEVTSFTREGIEDLLRVILGQPGHIPPLVGEPPALPILSGNPPKAMPGSVSWAPLDAPADVVWRADIADLAWAEQTVELHLIPTENTHRCSVRQLRELATELAGLGHQHLIIPRWAKMNTDSSNESARAFLGNAGFAVLRSGQRSSWFLMAARELYQDDFVKELAARIQLLLAVNLEHPELWVPTIGVDPVGTQRAAIRVPPIDSVTDRDLRQRPIEVAEELAARLVDTLREPEPPKRAEPEAERGVRVVNQITGSVIGKVIQAGDIHGDINL